MKRFLKAAAAACAMSMLVACGGGGGGTTAASPVAADVGAITLNEAGSLVVAQTLATSGQAITFAGGLPVLGLAGSTTLTFPTATTFSATNGISTVTGTVEYGTIKFNIASGPLAGTDTGFLPFLIDLNTSGVPGNGSSASVPVIITIGTENSNGTTITITISSNAAIQIGGQTVGSVTFSSTTGATGGS